MPEYVWIFDNRQGFKYVSCYLHSAKSLYKYSLQGTHYNEYLLRDRSIQNLIEDLRWRALSTFAANSILNFARYRVLNMSEFWIFVHFRKHDRVLNMRCNAIMKGFWIFQDSGYDKCCTRFWICLNMAE